MKKPLLISLTALAVLGITTATTLYAQTATGSSVIARMKATAANFTLTELIPTGQTGLTSAPLVGKKTGDVLTAGEYNRLLEMIAQGGTDGSGWENVPLTGSDSFDKACEYRFYMNAMGFDAVYYINAVTPTTLIYISHSNVISSIPSNNKTSYQVDGSSLFTVSKIEKLCGSGGTGPTTASSTNSNITYINPDNTGFTPLVCTPGVNYMINPIAFSAESASSFTTRKMAVLGAGNWQVKGTGFVRIRNKNSDVAQTLRVSSILDSTTTHLLDSALDLGMYANSFLAPVSIPAGKTAELQVSVKNNTLHGGNIVAWCTN